MPHNPMKTSPQSPKSDCPTIHQALTCEPRSYRDICPKWTLRCTRAHVHQFRLDMNINRPGVDFLSPPVNFLCPGTAGLPVFWSRPQCLAPWWSQSSPSSSLPFPSAVPLVLPFMVTITIAMMQFEVHRCTVDPSKISNKFALH